MHVAVGSDNPVKRDAVAEALAGHGIDTPLDIEAVAVDSGVPEQPRGHDETVAGAQTRATRAREWVGATLGVGLEGGVAEFEGTEGLYLIMWAAATDGKHWGRGAGPSYRLPPAVESRVRDGDELGPVMDDVLGEESVGRKQGAAGAFTAGRVTRADALATAVAGALGPFVTGLYG